MNDECWFCGKPIEKDEVYVEVVLCKNGEAIEDAVVHRTCLPCAIKDLHVAQENVDACLNQ